MYNPVARSPEGQRGLSRELGSIDEVLRGHLRTSFELTNEEMGEGAFSHSLDLFCEQVSGVGRTLAGAAKDFVFSLRWSGASPQAVVVARYELAKREIVHVGPQPLSAADLHRASAGQLLGMRVRRHPGARAIAFDEGAPAALVARYPNLADSAGLLLAGRKCGALVLPLDTDELSLFAKLARSRDLFDVLVGDKANGASPSAFHRLVTLGAVVAA